jgi:hypothetical protein
MASNADDLAAPIKFLDNHLLTPEEIENLRSMAFRHRGELSVFHG